MKSLTRATAKAAASRLRALGLLQSSVDWQSRAETCERCPMRVIHRGVSYCGKPFLQQVNRDEALDGCGCPIHAKAKDAAEHCPITPGHLPASRVDGSCNCKWCAQESPRLANRGL